jgi:Tol biopolymer transport system component
MERAAARIRPSGVVAGIFAVLAAVLATAGAVPARPVAGAATTTLVSMSTSGEQGIGNSWATGISADGRFVAFSSEVSSLVAHDTNRQSDVFVRDRRTGETTRVSVTSSGAQAHESPHEFGGSQLGGISANGRYVAFVSDATNLVPRDTNRLFDVFVHDRVTGKTQRVSVSSAGRQGYGESDQAAISAHGRYVAFSSLASNLVPRDSNRNEDVFVHDRRTGKTQRVSVSSSGKQSKGPRGRAGSVSPVISGDGRYVAFGSAASNLVPGDTNRVPDIFVHDRVTGKTQRVSVSSAGAQANGDSADAAISPNGRYVAFDSFASNLVPGDSNGAGDVFVYDRVTHRTLLASLSSSGEQGNDTSYSDAGFLSADGRYLAFSSWASNLAPDTNPNPDVFVRDFGAPPA